MPTGAPMAIFDRWSVVAVPFPCMEGDRVQRRPAVVVSEPILARRHGLYWVVMVTSAENPRWPDDVAVSDLALAGLPRSSVIRPAKIATIQQDRVVRRLGELALADRRAVRGAMKTLLGKGRGKDRPGTPG